MSECSVAALLQRENRIADQHEGDLNLPIFIESGGRLIYLSKHLDLGVQRVRDHLQMVISAETNATSTSQSHEELVPVSLELLGVRAVRVVRTALAPRCRTTASGDHPRSTLPLSPSSIFSSFLRFSTSSAYSSLFWRCFEASMSSLYSFPVRPAQHRHAVVRRFLENPPSSSHFLRCARTTFSPSAWARTESHRSGRDVNCDTTWNAIAIGSHQFYVLEVITPRKWTIAPGELWHNCPFSALFLESPERPPLDQFPFLLWIPGLEYSDRGLSTGRKVRTAVWAASTCRTHPDSKPFSHDISLLFQMMQNSNAFGLERVLIQLSVDS